MISILTITVHTNIPGFKIILYNPSMTLQQESPESIIFIPESVKINDKDLKANDSSQHDKIKTFLSPNALKIIIDKKSGKQLQNTGENVRHNIGKIISLLFSKEEFFYIDGKPYSIFFRQWAAEQQTNNIQPVDTVYKVNRKTSNTVVSSPEEFKQSFSKVNLYNIRVNLGLVKAEDKIKKSGYCALKEYEINELVDEIAQDLDKWLGEEIDDDGVAVEKMYNTPKGFISLRDWRKVSGKSGKRDYFVNIVSGRSRFTSPFPVMSLTNQIVGWNLPTPPPSPPQESFVLVPQSQVTDLSKDASDSDNDVAPPLLIPSTLPVQPTPSAPPPSPVSPPSGGSRRKIKKNKTRKNNKFSSVRSKNQLNKTIKIDSARISTALKKNGMDNGNISVFLASQTPEKYFSHGQIKNLRG